MTANEAYADLIRRCKRPRCWARAGPYWAGTSSVNLRAKRRLSRRADGVLARLTHEMSIAPRSVKRWRRPRAAIWSAIRNPTRPATSARSDAATTAP
jgi:hypothetical protein